MQQLRDEIELEAGQLQPEFGELAPTLCLACLLLGLPAACLPAACPACCVSCRLLGLPAACQPAEFPAGCIPSLVSWHWTTAHDAHPLCLAVLQLLACLLLAVPVLPGWLAPLAGGMPCPASPVVCLQLACPQPRALARTL